MEIIGYRKRNGKIEQEFTPMVKKSTMKNLEIEREEFIKNNDCDGVDFAYRQKISRKRLERELSELGLTIEGVESMKQKALKK